MTAEHVHSMEILLARIEERVKEIQLDIKAINEDRRCHTHTEKIKTLERLVWGCVGTVSCMVLRVLYEILKAQ